MTTGMEMSGRGGDAILSRGAAGTVIGKPLRRKEDERLLTGAGEYADDVRLAGALHLVLVRSPHARARILEVDVTAARNLPDVAVFTAGDLPELESALPSFTEAASNPYTVHNSPPPQFALASGEARHVGEPIVAVLARDPYLAADAADLVRVRYEPMEPVTDPERAMTADSAQVHAGQSNVVGHLRWAVGDVDRAFRDADIVLEERFTYGRVSPMPIEPRTVCAQSDPRTRVMTIWAAHQFPYTLRDAVARFLALPADSVRVIARDIGGAFGSKAAVYPEDVLVPVLAHRLGTSVRWTQTRSEFLIGSHHGRDQLQYVRLAARGDGTVLGLELRIIKDVGAYHYFALIDPTNTVNHAPGHYKIPHVRAEGFCVVTNKVPVTPYRGAGRPEGVFAIERMMDLLARRVGLDPAEVRLRNTITPDAMPYHSGLIYRDGVAIVYDGGDYPAELRKALELADYQWLRREQQEWRRGGRYVGIGLASYVEAGGIGWPCEGAAVKVDEHGNVDVAIGVSSSGQGHETVFAQVCADHLGARYEDIRVHGGDTALMPYGFGTGASRVAVNTGNAVLLAAEAVKRKACHVVARLLECDSADVRIEEGRAFVVGAPMRALSLGDVAKAALRDQSLAVLGSPGLWDVKFYYPRTVTWSSGVHLAVVEVDPDTGAVTLLKHVIVHDCGTPLNPEIVEGQIVGGFAQGVGEALMERIVYDEAGQLLTGTMMDYAIPRAVDVPTPITEHLVFPTAENRLGVRGVGEGATGAAATAIANAVADAFEGGLRIVSPALVSARVRALVLEARGGGSRG
jgi:carbon-monoxide dehydrogenase large subunit